MIPPIDLMPPARRRERLVRRRIRRWAWIVALSLGVLAPAAGVLHRSVDPALLLQSRSAFARVEASRAALGDLHAQMDGLAHQRRMSGIIARRPDYARLVDALADAVGDQIPLEMIAIDRSMDSTNPDHALVTISGLAQSQLEAQQLAVRLEDLGVFRSVNLAQAQRRPTVVGDLVAFRIVAVLRGDGS